MLLILFGGFGAWFALMPGFGWAQQDKGIAASTPQEEFGERVRTYLLEHPEVITEALNRLEARQGGGSARKRERS